MDSSGSVQRIQSFRVALQNGYGESAVERPLRPELPPAEAAPPQTVLLLDDNPATFALIEQSLGIDYHTICATSVEEALRIVGKTAVALLLLRGELLSRSGGAKVLESLRRASPRSRLPMVVISDDLSSLTEASDMGVEDYLPNAFDIHDLLHVVDEHCL